MAVKAHLTADSGTCRGIKQDGARCTYAAKVDGFCGVHAGKAVAKPGTAAKQQGGPKAVLGPGQWGKCQGVTGDKRQCPNSALADGYCTVHAGQAIKPKPVAAAKPATPDYGKCKGIKNDGDRCTNNAHASGFCKVHEAQATKPKLAPPPKPSTSVMVTRSKAAAKLAKADKRLLPTGDSVTNAMGSSTRSDLPSAKAHWINCAGPWPAMCCAHQCTRAADRGGHVFITGKFMTVYLVPVCAAHNAVKQNFRVNAGTIAVEDPTVSVLGIGCMGWKHLIAKNFTLAL